jgi:hypothetical protein
MPRPKSEDPKRPLTIRLPASMLSQLGTDAEARSKIEAMVAASLRPKPVIARPAASQRHVDQVKIIQSDKAKRTSPPERFSLPLGRPPSVPGSRLKNR